MQGLSGVQSVLKQSESVPHHGRVPYVSVIFNANQSFATVLVLLVWLPAKDLAHVIKSAIAHS